MATCPPQLIISKWDPTWSLKFTVLQQEVQIFSVSANTLNWQVISHSQWQIPTFLMTSLRKIISVSFMVRSSSLVPDFRSLTTEGLMQRGGTRRRVRMRSAGFPASGFISSRGMSSWGILLKRFSTTRGFRFSYQGNDNQGNMRRIQGCTELCTPCL